MDTRLLILGLAKPVETREFHILSAITERWASREFERQLRSGAALRGVQTAKKVSPAVRQFHPTAIDDFKSAHNIGFLGLGAEHSEADLHGALLRNPGRFLTESGRDFCFVGSRYPMQVGDQDFAVDLVFFHRGLQWLVAFELKTGEFKPTDPGQLSSCVEALGRDVKKPHERPSIGVLLCATRDDKAVEDALARTASPPAQLRALSGASRQPRPPLNAASPAPPARATAAGDATPPGPASRRGSAV